MKYIVFDAIVGALFGLAAVIVASWMLPLVPSLIIGGGVGAGLFLMLLWLQGAHARERVEGREQEAGAGGR